MNSKQDNATHTPTKLTAAIGTKGASIYYENDAAHPLTFGIHWGNEYDAELVEKGQSLARLVTAAPDLLTVLRKCAKELGVNDPNDHAYESELAGEVRAAIAKATAK